MNRKTLIALVTFLALLGAGYMVVKSPQKGERVGERERPLAKLDAKKLNKVSITAKGKTVVLERAGKDQWKLVKPVAYAADKHSADTVVEKLGALEFGDLVTQQKAKHAQYQVDAKAGIRVQAWQAGKQVADFYLGQVLEDFTMLRLANKDEVHQVVGAVRYAFERDVNAWRNKSIVEFKQEEARKLELTTKGAGTIVLARKDDKAPWKVEQSPVKIDQLDTTAVTDFLSTAQSLSAHDFGDKLTLAQAGLDQPAATLKVSLKGGKSVTLLMGDAKGDAHRVKLPGKPQIFLIQQHSAKNLLKRPIDFRDKTVLSFKEGDAVALTLTKQDKGKPAVTIKLARKGAEWQVNGKAVKDAAKVTDAVKELSSLKAAGFAHHSAAELGLDKASCTVELQLKDRTTHVITVGSVDKDGAFGLTRKGVEDLFTLPKYTVDRICFDPKDYL